MPSAACVSTASTVRTSTSLWCASIAWTTSSCSPYLRAISAPMIAWLPSTSWVSALPTSCRTVQRLMQHRVEPQLARHHPGDVRRLDEVLEHVLAVRRAVAQLAEQGDELGVHLGETDLDEGVLAGPDAELLDLGLAALVDLLDPVRVDPPVEDELARG